MENIIEYVETSPIPLNRPSMLLGIPDTGLSGSIASSFIFEKLGLKEIGHFESQGFPPMSVVHDKKPCSPMRLYANSDVVVLLSEMPIPLALSYDLSRTLINWFREKNGSLMITLGGLPEAKRNEIEKPKVYGVGTNDSTRTLIAEKGFEAFEEGLIMGTNGAVLRDCVRHKLSAIYLMAESYGKYPDPGAAASLVDAVSKILKIEIDTKELIAKGEEIRLGVRDLMKQTQKSMDDSDRFQKEMPMMYR